MPSDFFTIDGNGIYVPRIVMNALGEILRCDMAICTRTLG